MPTPSISNASVLDLSMKKHFPHSELDERSITDDDYSTENYNRVGCPRLINRMRRTPNCERVVGVWIVYEDLNGCYSEWTGWEIPETPLPLPYDIRPIAGKGRGMIANRKISCGETIVRERAVLLYPVFSARPGGWEAIEKGLHKMVALLEPEDREKLLSLHNCKSPEECGPIAGILRTNAIQCYFPQAKFSRNYGGVCLDISRANHSCSPNASVCFDRKTLVVELRATRDIIADEEITITYTSLHYPRAIRQKELQKKYCFTCTCAICSASPSAISVSDNLRKLVKVSCRSLFPMWKMWFNGEGSGMSATRLLGYIQTLMGAAQKEGMDKARAFAVRWLASTYAALGDEKNFVKWATEAVQLVPVLEDGEGGFLSADDWKDWLREPTTMPFWGRMR